MSEKLSYIKTDWYTHLRHFSRANCPSYGPAMRKQWAQYLNDAVSIFQSWQGGQSPGIIVMRPTGCPEEEVSAELYASIQGQGGALQGDSHWASSSAVLKSLAEMWGYLPNPGCHDLSGFLHRLGISNYLSTSDTDRVHSHEEKMETQKS